MNIDKHIQRFIPALVFSLLLPLAGHCKPVVFKNGIDHAAFNKEVEILVDTTARLDETNIARLGSFSLNEKSSIFFLKDKALWGRFSVTNQSLDTALFFSVQYSNIADISFYRVDEK